MHAVSDEQLIQWVAQGDASCVGTLFERHHKGVYRYCLQITKQPPMSEDVVQEVFLKVMKKAKSYRGDGSFKAWLFNIARNVTFDHLKSAQRRAQPPGLLDQASPSSEDLVSGSQELGRVSKALASLPEKVREVIWLGRFEFDGYEELAVALGCSPGTARVRMHRAMKQLASAFGEI
ncbi:MAG: RNA polymerase sigma factor [Pseudomonadota bacterium]